MATNTWTYYDFNPQLFGFASGNWMDFPNLTVSTNFLYATSNGNYLQIWNPFPTTNGAAPVRVE